MKIKKGGFEIVDKYKSTRTYLVVRINLHTHDRNGNHSERNKF